MKSFGNQNPLPAQRLPFSFTVLRDEAPETHIFQAVLRLDAASLTQALEAAKNDSADIMSAFSRTIRKMLDNTDGIPSKWKPTAVPQIAAPSQAITHVDGVQIAGVLTDETGGVPKQVDMRPPSFRVPYGHGKGNLLPMSEAQTYLDNEVHSSRRRWLELMEGEDDDVVVDLNDLIKLFEWLVQGATGKTTGASS